MLQERVKGGWKPADNEAAAYTLKAKYGEIHEFKITKPRNVKFNRKFNAMVDLVAANQNKIDFCTVKQGRERMKYAACFILKLGEFWGPDKQYFERVSFKFKDMTEEDFSEIYNQILDVFLKYFVPMNKPDFERELLSFGG